MLKLKIFCISLLLANLLLPSWCCETLGCRNQQGIRGRLSVGCRNPLFEYKTIVRPMVKNKYNNLVEPSNRGASTGLLYFKTFMEKESARIHRLGLFGYDIASKADIRTRRICNCWPVWQPMPAYDSKSRNVSLLKLPTV